MGLFLNTGAKASTKFNPVLGAWYIKVKRGLVATAITKVLIGGEGTSKVKVYGGWFINLDGTGAITEGTIQSITGMGLRMTEAEGYIVVYDIANIKILGNGTSNPITSLLESANDNEPYCVFDVNIMPPSLTRLQLSARTIVKGDINIYNSKLYRDYYNYNFYNVSSNNSELEGTATTPIAGAFSYLMSLTNNNGKNLRLHSSIFKNMRVDGIVNLQGDLQLYGSWKDFVIKSVIAHCRTSLTGTIEELQDGVMHIESNTANAISGDISKSVATLRSLNVPNCSGLKYTASKAWAGNLYRVVLTGTDFSQAETEQMLIDFNNTTWDANTYLRVKSTAELTAKATNAIAGLQSKGVSVTISK